MRIFRTAALSGGVAAALAAVPVLAEEAVDPAPLAEAFVKIGCHGTEKDIFPYVGSNGLEASSFGAQFKALAASGHLVSDDHGETFRLTNWGPCE